mmetsp:Transcript_8920/g.24721  ORF Transcript_8920/g.24721 Transcript_8920/m.24721 type:complete len:244 (-) Transcript_8920:76-807(-)
MLRKRSSASSSVGSRRSTTLTTASSLPLVLALLLLGFGGRHLAHAFSNYLLASGGCYVELDDTEVIMNYQVVPPVANPPLVLSIVSPTPGLSYLDVNDEDPTQPEIVLLDPERTTFPLEIQFKVVPTPPSPSGDNKPTVGYGYEYVLQIVGSDNETDQDMIAASFADGACEGARRVAGRSMDTVLKMTLTQAPSSEGGITVQAGWAEGHEAVKLLRGIRFVTHAGGAEATVDDDFDDEVAAEF